MSNVTEETSLETGWFLNMKQLDCLKKALQRKEAKNEALANELKAIDAASIKRDQEITESFSKLGIVYGLVEDSDVE